MTSLQHKSQTILSEATREMIVTCHLVFYSVRWAYGYLSSRFIGKKLNALGYLLKRENRMYLEIELENSYENCFTPQNFFLVTINYAEKFDVK